MNEQYFPLKNNNKTKHLANISFQINQRIYSSCFQSWADLSKSIKRQKNKILGYNALFVYDPHTGNSITQHRGLYLVFKVQQLVLVCNTTNHKILHCPLVPS